MYPTHGIESLTCRRTWWHNLLYINNFFDMKDSCIPASWFLATSMQLHWVAPLFLLAVSWKWLVGMLVAIAFISVDIITTSVIVSKNGYDRGQFGDLYANRSNWTSSSSGYFNDVYVKPWCRAAPYAVGLAFGYILFEIYQRSNTLTWESLRPTLTPTPTTRYHRLKQVMAWTFALAVLALCVFGTYGDYEGHPLTRSERIAFLTLSRLGWAIGLSVIIGSCFFGRGGLANKFLSWSIFHSLAKLTYGAYLWHSLVIAVNYLGREQPTHYTVANVFFNWIVYIVISYFLSFVTFLFIELPIVQLIKSTFKRPTNHQ
jgi:peptidoglycan/LPS O-acetylase OafA/YrhL